MKVLKVDEIDISVRAIVTLGSSEDQSDFRSMEKSGGLRLDQYREHKEVPDEGSLPNDG